VTQDYGEEHSRWHKFWSSVGSGAGELASYGLGHPFCVVLEECMVNSQNLALVWVGNLVASAVPSVHF